VEYYCPAVEALAQFLGSEAFRQVIALIESYSDSFLPIAAELQHVFFTTTGDQPLSAGWLNAYGKGLDDVDKRPGSRKSD